MHSHYDQTLGPHQKLRQEQLHLSVHHEMQCGFLCARVTHRWPPCLAFCCAWEPLPISICICKAWALEKFFAKPTFPWLGKQVQQVENRLSVCRRLAPMGQSKSTSLAARKSQAPCGSAEHCGRRGTGWRGDRYYSWLWLSGTGVVSTRAGMRDN